MSRLYGAELKSPEDFSRLSERLRLCFETLIVDMFQRGNSVIWDFPANTADLRAMVMSVVARGNASYCLHYVDAHPEVCRSRMHLRNQSMSHEFKVTDNQFDFWNGQFAPPSTQEGLSNVRRYVDIGTMAT